MRAKVEELQWGTSDVMDHGRFALKWRIQIQVVQVDLLQHTIQHEMI